MGLAILLLLLFYGIACIAILAAMVWLGSFFYRKISLREIFLFVSYIALLAFFASIIDREPNVTSGNLTWDLINSRDINRLSGGAWVGEDLASTYYLKGDRRLNITVILDDNRQFIFDNVSNVYVHRTDSKINRIKIASFGHSKQGAINLLKKMHQQWNGQGVDGIDKWISDTKEGSLRRHNTRIHNSLNIEDPSILASIGGPQNAWYVMTTFLWPDPRFNKFTSKKPMQNAEMTNKGE